MIEKKKKYGLLAWGMLPALLPLAPNVALAQSNADTLLEEVVVSARKREEALIDVPLAISVFDSGVLERARVTSVADLAALTPGMTLFQFGSEFYNTPVIRGMAQTQTLRNVEANVATFLDGVYVVNTGAVNFALMDFERIEVVKGPVSAMYGRNAFAGAINYVSKVPTENLEGKAEAIVGSDDRYRAAGSIGGGVIPGKLAARAGVSYDSFGGTWRDPVNGERMGDYEKLDGQLTARLTPSDTVTVDAALYYGRNESGVNPRVPLAPNCALVGTLLRNYCGQIPDADELPPPEHPTNYPGELSAADQTVIHGKVRLEVEFEPFSVESLTGYFDVANSAYVDLNGRRNGLSYNLVPGPGRANLNVFYGQQFDSKDFSQEFRISSRNTESVRWSVGGFYFDSDQITNTFFGSNQSQLPAGQRVGGNPGLWLTPDGSPSAFSSLANSGVRQMSGFGSVDADFGESTTATAELRYTDERRTQDIISSASAPGLNPDGDGDEASYGYWDTRLSVIHKLTPNSRVYASAAHGTKSGGFSTGATLPEDLAFGPEKNWTYEIGTKNTFNRFSVNAAIYYIDWKGLQQAALPNDPNNPAVVTKNFGDAESSGFELDTQIRIAKGVVATLGASLSRPRFKDNAFDLTPFGRNCGLIPECAPRVTVVNGRPGARLGGTTLPRTSDWQFNASLDVARPLARDWNWTARTDFSYQSKQYQRNLEIIYVPSSVNLNAQIGVENEAYSVVLWGNNLTNNQVPYSAFASTRLDNFVAEEVVGLPVQRTYGLTLRVKF